MQKEMVKTKGLKLTTQALFGEQQIVQDMMSYGAWEEMTGSKARLFFQIPFQKMVLTPLSIPKWKSIKGLF